MVASKRSLWRAARCRQTTCEGVPPRNFQTVAAHQRECRVNYFAFHVGDYAAHTRHLSLLEDLAYRRLLDAYYLSERPLNGSPADVARLIGMREHADEVEFVLKSFFFESEDGFRNKRADQEIEAFSAKRQQQSRAGKASAERRLSERSTSVQRTFNQPITKNQEPRTNIPPTPRGESATPPGFVRFWETWPKSTRKGGKAACLKVWGRAKLETEVEAILAHVVTMTSSQDWRKNAGEFIPAPLVYLNQRRWDGAEQGSHQQQDPWAGAA